MNHFELFQIVPSPNEPSLPSPIMDTPTARHIPIHSIFDTESSSCDEDELTEQLKELINRFMTTRAYRHRSFQTTIRWTVDDGDQMNYSVVIRLEQPAYLI